MGKAKRYNVYDGAVANSRKRAELYGAERQKRSIGSSFRAPIPARQPLGGGGGSSNGALQDPIILNEKDLGTISGANNIDWSLANFHRCVISGSTTFTMTNLPAAGKYQQVVLEIKQDGTGNHAVTFADTFLNGTSPTIALPANTVTTITFYQYDDGTDRILAFNTVQVSSLSFALGDETTAINQSSTSIPVLTFRMPYAMTLTEVRASLTQASNSGLVAINIKEAGIDILSTDVTIDATERTSTTAATPGVINDSSLADDAEIQVYITQKGNNAAGLKVTMIGYIT